MLKKLVIEQFVIIDRLEVDFQAGLTIITGDTGAGKSILLDALGAILGDPADPKAIRHGAVASTFDATFAPPASNGIWKLLVQHELVEFSQKEFIVHRRVTQDGAEEISLDGKPIEREFLQEMGTFLTEIHGQFANQSLMDPQNQLNWLDMSGAFPPEIFKNVADALRDVHRFTKELEDEKIFLAQHKEQLPRIENHVKRFESVEMREGLVEEVQAEYDTLLTARETTEALQAILSQLIASQGVVGSLKSANQILAHQENVNRERVADLEKYLADALASSHAAVNEMRRILPEYEIDTTPIYECEKILEILYKLSVESDTEFEDLFGYYEEMCTKLARIRNGRERIVELENSLISAKSKYHHHAHILTEKRIIAGEALSKAITGEFANLKLMNAEFKVVVEEKPDIKWTEKGFNIVTYTARMNPGMPFSPIAETASGGELARMILALKVILQGIQATGTLVFDEVDTGIGGPAAAAVGERLAKLADSTQVLVITHSPQVASRGDQHLHVSKKTSEGTTVSAVRKLTQEERIDEIARMLAGDQITGESQAAAERLLGEGTQAAEARRELIKQEKAERERARLKEAALNETGPEEAEQQEEQTADIDVEEQEKATL